ncbi:LutC/YkgG family protein [Thermoactinomyces mirandus]|uniref:Lactate utilization protein C n=1 Tax=Thermoactinomyces mirandus TaxID=2756294 RepID=A0A7W1XRU1_9BACL|nr:lactate utilization protein C [Thermoactinomyces mirandus]MBA4602142.1 lactate utilization protein C [Thermoactinomyces mirandus]
MKGTIHNRDSFLNHIASQLGRDHRTAGITRPAWKHDAPWEVMKDYTEEQLLEVFKKQCRNIHTAVIETSKTQLPGVLKKLVSENGGGPVIIPEDSRFEEYGLTRLLKQEWPQENVPVYQWQAKKREENLKAAETSNFSILFSDYTLAESGTVCVKAKKGLGRALHYLPANYIAIVPRHTLVPRLTQAVHDMNRAIGNGEPAPSSIHFISGPSNSADIEMNLVVGVHGPLQAFYVLV